MVMRKCYTGFWTSPAPININTSENGRIFTDTDLSEYKETAIQHNINILTEKTYMMVITKELTRCKLMSKEKIIEEVRKFKYLGADIESNMNTIEEV